MTPIAEEVTSHQIRQAEAHQHADEDEKMLTELSVRSRMDSEEATWI